MRRRLLTGFALLTFLSSIAQTSPKGIAPRKSPADYPAHSMVAGGEVGAKLLNEKDTRKALAVNVRSCCLVVEVAFYPQKNEPISTSPGLFSLRPADGGKELTAESGATVASAVQRKALDSRDISVAPHGTVGYQTGGYDPKNGRYGPGTFSSAEISVAKDPRGSHPGSAEAERSAAETELNEKGLRDGEAAEPTAGYLYFELPRSKASSYRLIYKLNGEAVTLPLH